MKKFEVSFYDTFEEETEEGVYDTLLSYLQEVVKHQDVTAFQVFEITKKEEESKAKDQPDSHINEVRDARRMMEQEWKEEQQQEDWDNAH